MPGHDPDVTQTQDVNTADQGVMIKKLAEQIDSLKTIQDVVNTLKDSLTEYKTSLEFAHKQAQEAKEESRRALLEVSELRKEVSGLKYKLAQTENLHEKFLSLETYSRRENLIFDGIPESAQESCLEKVYDVLQNNMNIRDARDNIMFQRVHRLGHMYAGGRPRPIIAKFCWAQDWQRVWDNRRLLKSTNIWISQDFPAEVRQRRQVLSPILHAANKQSNMQASLVADTLYINRRAYTINNLQYLPEPVQLQNTSLQTEGNHVFFYGRNSPLSNFFPVKFKVNGVIYSCSEQFYQSSKAEKHNRYDLRDKIMLQTDPAAMYRIGKEINGGDDWKKEKVSIMESGLMAKFEQNPFLKKVLLHTENKTLVEAGPNTFWGIGLNMRDSRKNQMENWKGENNLGLALERIRQRLSSL